MNLHGWQRSGLASWVMVAAALATGVRPARAAPLDDVSILQGTDADLRFSRGSDLPLVGEPWGLTDWAIQTTGTLRESRFFVPGAHTFAGFRATRQPSCWSGDHGQVLFLPQSGPPVLDVAGRAADYTADVLRPDAVRVRIPRYHVTAELTASARSAVLRLAFDPGDAVGRLVIDPAGPAELHADGAAFTGFSRFHAQAAPANFHAYFVGRVDRPITRWAPPTNGQAGYVEFDLTGQPTVEVRIGTSFISSDAAERNLNAETDGGFDATRGRTAAAWNAQLGRLAIDGTPEQRRTFYSCLYRALKFPHRLDEPDAAGHRVHYSPWDGRVHDGPAYTDDGLWDTYRTDFPLLSIAYADQLGDILAGWLNAYREGGWLPNWPTPGGFNAMPGTHADAMIADAMVKGVGGFDYATAYAAVRRDSFDVPSGPFAGGRPKLATLLRVGYLPQGRGVSGVSDTLDYAYDDWCVGQAATVVGRVDDAKVLAARAQAYRKLWDADVKLMRPKDASGDWANVPFDQFAWGGAYVEGGPWQCSWAVQQDVAGLADLTGGRAAFAAVLDKLFSLPPAFHPGGYGRTIHEMTEMPACGMGQCSMNNQPSFHIPYLYAAVGRPWRTEYWTRRACRTLFNAGPQGYPGDEDTGSMGAWYVLSSIGLYPLTPGHPSYVLTCPVFRRVTIQKAGGRPLVIDAPGNTDATVYVAARTLNGRPYTAGWISHADVVAGGTLAVTVADHPTARELTGAELPYSASYGRP